MGYSLDIGSTRIDSELLAAIQNVADHPIESHLLQEARSTYSYCSLLKGFPYND